MRIKRFDGTFDYAEVAKEAVKEGYTWMVLKRDAYRGNCDTDYFEAKDFDYMMEKYPFFFFNEERPVYAVIITDIEPKNAYKMRRAE